MKRREFLALVSGLTVAWPLTPGAQQAKVARVGVLTPANSSDTLVFQSFREGLREFGYVDGNTIILDYRLAKGVVGILATLAEELVRIPVDIIVTDGTSSA